MQIVTSVLPSPHTTFVIWMGARPPLPRARRPAHTRLCYSSSSEDRRIGPLVALPLRESRVVLPVKLNAVLVPLAPVWPLDRGPHSALPCQLRYRLGIAARSQVVRQSGRVRPSRAERLHPSHPGQRYSMPAESGWEGSEARRIFFKRRKVTFCDRRRSAPNSIPASN